jgi:hypothetical protein
MLRICLVFTALLAACGGGGSSSAPLAEATSPPEVTIELKSLERLSGDMARLKFSFAIDPPKAHCHGWVDWTFYIWDPDPAYWPFFWRKVATARLPQDAPPDSYTVDLDPGVEWGKVVASLKVSIPKDLIIKSIIYKEEP